MSLDRVQITNYERWGNLIKTWATGKDYVRDGNPYPVPKTLTEFEEQLQRAQVGASIPKGVHGVQFIQMNDETLLIRLPPKAGIEAAEAELTAGETYVLPPFYRRVFGGADPVIPEAEKLRFQAERIGDYTISFCM